MLAVAAGCTLGPIVTVVEGGGGGPIPIPRGPMRAMAAPVEAGTDTLSLNVTASYELEVG